MAGIAETDRALLRFGETERGGPRVRHRRLRLAIRSANHETLQPPPERFLGIMKLDRLRLVISSPNQLVADLCLGSLPAPTM